MCQQLPLDVAIGNDLDIACDAESELVSQACPLDWDFRLTSDQWRACFILTKCVVEELRERE